MPNLHLCTAPFTDAAKSDVVQNKKNGAPLHKETVRDIKVQVHDLSEHVDK